MTLASSLYECKQQGIVDSVEPAYISKHMNSEGVYFSV